MERSRVTVEYRHLHQQVFEHEVEGVHCVVQTVTGSVPEHLTLGQALDAVQSRLTRWNGPKAGFAEPVTEYQDMYRLIVPELVQWDLWPRVYACERCGLVMETDEHTVLSRNCSISKCGRVFRQLPYYRVHRCGRRRQLAVPRCPVDEEHNVAFHDSGSFVTAYFTCTVCRTRHEINAGSCNCTLPVAGRDRRFRLVRARDSKAFFPQHVTVVNITARLARALETPRGPLWAFAHYLGNVSNLHGLVDETTGRASTPGDDEKMQKILEILENTPGLGEEQRAELLSTVQSKCGEEPGLEATNGALPLHIIEQARTDRRLMERAFVFHEHHPDDLADVEQRYRNDGHHGMAARAAAGRTLADELGFCRVSVVRELPIALVGFGFTREFSDERAQIQPLEPPAREKTAKRPLVTIESNTEAIYFELDPVRLWSWCHTNGWTSEVPVTEVKAARAWLVRTTYDATPDAAALAVQRLTHAWAHSLIHALEGRSAFGPNSVSEYLMERVGAFLLYVANYSSFNLGGLTTVTEQHLADWLDAARERTICVHDPVCLSEREGAATSVSHLRSTASGSIVVSTAAISSGVRTPASEKDGSSMPAELPEAPDASAVLDLLDLADDPGAAVARLCASTAQTRADLLHVLCPTADHATQRAIAAVLESLGIGSSLTRDDLATLVSTLDFALSVKAVTVSRMPPPRSRLAVTATTAPELTELRRQLHLPPLVQLVEDVIRSAAGVCVLGAPYWNVAALERLSPALSGFARRGGRTEFICQGGAPDDQYNPVPALRRLSTDLRAVGGSARIWTFAARDDAGQWAQLHAKFALADREYGYLGSANMTGQGFGHHFEIGVRLSAAEASELADLLDKLKLGSFLLPD